MKLSFYAILEAILLLFASILWCELGYYYYVFSYGCSGWPGHGEGSQNLTKIYVLTDIHIMGPIKSAKIDKLRREWQMEQAYRMSNHLYKPDLVLFLGDILDEGSFSSNDAFKEATLDFNRIFPIFEDKPRIVIAGNHDVGLHDRMLQFPILMHRFGETFNATSGIELIRFNDLNIVNINSMSFYNDTCPYCKQSISHINEIAKRLHAEQTIDHDNYAAPILLTHIPLYRSFDTSCDYPASLRERVKKKNIEGEDVLHELASQFILEKLNPRLILSGHTHMNCLTNHTSPNDRNKISQELTLTAFNHKYSELNPPSLLLVSANSTHFYTRHCNLVDERIIVSIYVTVLLVICLRLAFRWKGTAGKNEESNK